MLPCCLPLYPPTSPPYLQISAISAGLNVYRRLVPPHIRHRNKQHTGWITVSVKSTPWPYRTQRDSIIPLLHATLLLLRIFLAGRTADFQDLTKKPEDIFNRKTREHMNIHLVKLHIHEFTRLNYGSEVNLYPISSDERRWAFSVNCTSTCAVALTHVIHARAFFRWVHRPMHIIVRCANVGQAACRECILGYKYSLLEIQLQAHQLDPQRIKCIGWNWTSAWRGGNLHFAFV